MADWKPKTNNWPGCMECKHLRPKKGARCDAFPEGIPILIASNQVDHTVERPGQVEGIVFEPAGG